MPLCKACLDLRLGLTIYDRNWANPSLDKSLLFDNEKKNPWRLQDRVEVQDQGGCDT